MKMSEFKKRWQTSIFYEFTIKIYRFLKDYKFATSVIIAVIVLLSVAISPYVYKVTHKIVDVGSDEELTTINDDFKVEVTVCISGEVLNPGNYTLTEDDRISDLIELAGGVTEDADLSNINLAQKLFDEQYVQIPSIKDAKSKSITNTKTYSIVNINTATSEELQTLPGIGKDIADRIIYYRNMAGNFEHIMDIMNVEGIGMSKFDKIKNYITI